MSVANAQSFSQVLWRDAQGYLYLDDNAQSFYVNQDGRPFTDSQGYVYVVDNTNARYYLHPNQQMHTHIWDASGEKIAVYRDVQTYHVSLSSSSGALHFTSPQGQPYTTSNDLHFYLNAEGFPYRDDQGNLYVLDDLGRHYYLNEDGLPYSNADGIFLIDNTGLPFYLAN
ncbi:MAG: hypothetical protein AAF267_08360 [Deinococcota bacterium]